MFSLNPFAIVKTRKNRAARRTALKQTIARYERIESELEARLNRRNAAYERANARSKRNSGDVVTGTYFLVIEHEALITRLADQYFAMKSELETL